MTTIRDKMVQAITSYFDSCVVGDSDGIKVANSEGLATAILQMPEIRELVEAAKRAVIDLETGPLSQSLFMQCWDRASATLLGGCKSDLPRAQMEAAADNVAEYLRDKLKPFTEPQK